MIQMDTRNILFVCGGAFEGLDKVISQRVGKRTMGFGADGDDEPNSDTPDILSLVQPEDLLAYGMIPEFVGRVPVITTMDSLDADDLLRILTEPHDAIIKQSQRLFAMDGVEVEFTEESLRKIVALTVHKGTGARGPALRLRAGHDGHHVRRPLSEGRNAPASYGRNDRERDRAVQQRRRSNAAQTRLISQLLAMRFSSVEFKIGTGAHVISDGNEENGAGGASAYAAGDANVSSVRALSKIVQKTRLFSS